MCVNSESSSNPFSANFALFAISDNSEAVEEGSGFSPNASNLTELRLILDVSFPSSNIICSLNRLILSGFMASNLSIVRSSASISPFFR